MTATAYSSVWDLDVFFKGGSNSAEFQQHLQITRKHIDSFSNVIHKWEPSNSAADAAEISEIIELFQQTARKVRQAGAFVSCLQAQNTEDKKAKDLRGATTELSAGFQNALTVFDQKLASLDQSAWEQIIN